MFIHALIFFLAAMFNIFIPTYKLSHTGSRFHPPLVDISYNSVQFKIYKMNRFPKFLQFLYYQNSAVFYRASIYADVLVLDW